MNFGTGFSTKTQKGTEKNANRQIGVFKASKLKLTNVDSNTSNKVLEIGNHFGQFYIAFIKIRTRINKRYASEVVISFPKLHNMFFYQINLPLPFLSSLLL